jgi:hypothetical protein
MHSERILIFEPENSKLRKAGVGAYGNIMVRLPHCNDVLQGRTALHITMWSCSLI